MQGAGRSRPLRESGPRAALPLGKHLPKTAHPRAEDGSLLRGDMEGGVVCRDRKRRREAGLLLVVFQEGGTIFF